MAPSQRAQPKYYKYFEEFYSGGIERVDKGQLSTAYNAANSRFYNEAKRNEALGEPIEYAKKQRDSGTTLLEAIADLAWQWQSGRSRMPGLLFLTGLDAYNIEITDAFYTDGRAQAVDLEEGGFYHRQFHWVRMMDLSFLDDLPT
ncbi:hypothetical protein F4779DRAFT_356085 [Xylariaceae sp. FL0662B]|nr:hypothetical protein F4779DRAFT_356085 [Xylariaceae sp. FL0662B]